MIIKEWKLAYFQSGEWQVVEERLNDYDKEAHGTQYNPARRDLFAALRAVPYAGVRVCILGQDPYPQRVYCTGHAFSTPVGVKPLPPTLKNIFAEYEADLHYPAPKNGDLTKWIEQGVLLWNVYPTCVTGRPGSHHWDEWACLTREIIGALDEKGTVVFCALGSIAADFLRDCVSPSIRTSHPSPLGARFGFKGSRIFSQINEKLCSINQPTIDWRLDHEAQTSTGKIQKVGDVGS